jgi:allophanate hydrolase
MPDPLRSLNLCLGPLASLFKAGVGAGRDLFQQLLDRVDACPSPAVWVHRLSRGRVLEQLQTAEQRRRVGDSLPLFGVPFAVKDNIDVAGCPTTAACPKFAYTPTANAPVVQHLVDAGAILIGKTNLDQFATGLAGDRSPYGVCRNPFNADYIAGGSSSGSGVAVSLGLVSFALGTDTAGSGRVPAGCTNIVGLKPTPGALSTAGVVPACRSLDCVSVFALTAEDAFRVFEVAGGSRTATEAVASSAPRFAVPPASSLEFFGDSEQATAFGRAVDRMREMGWQASEFDFTPFQDVASLLYDGPWVAERLAAVGEFVQQHPEDVLPIIRSIISGASRYSAVDLFRAQYRLAELRDVCLKILNAVDFLVVPTMPTIPTVAEAQADSLGWGRRLGRYTNFVNLLGLAAIALPAGMTGRGLPAGVTLIGPANSEACLSAVGQLWQQQTGLPLGATGHELPASIAPVSRRSASMSETVLVSVAGAHLRGQPLHPALLKTGAKFVRTAQTAPVYRFMAFMHLQPPRPGLVRDEDHGGSVEVEIYEIPIAGFGALVASVAPPLAIGTVDLADGTAVKGFLCESWAARQAQDITEFGSWVNFLAKKSSAQAP